MLAYTEFIKQNGLKNTAQRKLLFNTVINMREHLTIDEVLQIVQKKYPKLGYTTVYRLLRLMVDAGILIEHHFDEKARFELSHNKAHHDHLICISCGNITEFSSDLIEKYQQDVAKKHSFKMVNHKHELYGLCNKCQ